MPTPTEPETPTENRAQGEHFTTALEAVSLARQHVEDARDHLDRADSELRNTIRDLALALGIVGSPAVAEILRASANDRR